MYSCAGLAEARGCPIRIFTDQSLFAAPRNFSQRTTSFIASQCQGIHQMLLSRLMLSLSMSIRGRPPACAVVQCPASADGTERTPILRKTYMCSICLPQSGQALRPTYANHASRRGQRKLASKSLHSRCQSARRQLNTERRNCFARSRRANPGIQHYRNGGARRDRTDDLKLAKLPLSQLSYGPVSPNMIRSDPRDRLQSGGPGKTRTSDLTLIKRAL